MEYNLGSNRASNFKSAKRVARGQFETMSAIIPELYDTKAKRNRCCLMTFHKVHGNPSCTTYSSRVGIGTVNHYSDWFEVDLLNKDITAANVISVTKAPFARYGIPDTFLSDNGPQYNCQEFVNFANTYGFKLITRSPYYARAAIKAEAAVKEAKRMVKKSDLLTGLLDHRNTPPQGMTCSLAQRFLCR